MKIGLKSQHQRLDLRIQSKCILYYLVLNNVVVLYLIIDFQPRQNPVPSGKPKSTLFEDEPEPDLFAETPRLHGSVKSEDNDRVKVTLIINI